jgi:hypothetical protein
MNDLQKLLVCAEIESKRLEAGTKAAAPRLRANLLEISRTCGALRKSALVQAKEMKTVPKVPKVPKAKAAAESELLLQLVLQRQNAEVVDASVAPKRRGRPSKPKASS